VDPDLTRRAWTTASIAAATGVTPQFVEELVIAGLLRRGRGDTFDAGALDVVRLAGRLAEHGLEPRHLRPLRASADRSVDLVDQLVAPHRRRQTVTAQAKAAALASEVGESLTRLHATWLRQGIAELD
jgi:hypothetical protein